LVRDGGFPYRGVGEIGFQNGFLAVKEILKEILAALLPVEAFAEFLRDWHVLLRSENSVTVFALRNWTLKSPVTMVLLRRFCSLIETFGITLSTEHNPGVLNLWADKLSRHRDAIEWFLSPSAFVHSQKLFPSPAVQVCCRRDTAVLPVLLSLQSDPACLAVVEWSQPLPPDTLCTPPPASIALFVKRLASRRPG
jgi:hypothetical protein